MQIIENFYSIQGEGLKSGEPSTFIRLNGCFLRCPWCDSKFTWKVSAIDNNNPKITYINDVNDFLKFYEKEINKNCKNIVITGGEPLWKINHNQLYSILYFLMQNSYSVTFETTLMFEKTDMYSTNIIRNLNFLKTKLFRPEIFKTILFSISPKFNLDSYIEETDEIKKVFYKDIFKFYSLNTYHFDSELLNNIFYKFVYEEEVSTQILEFTNNYVPKEFREKIYIMPKTPFPFNEEETQKIKMETAEFCKKYGFIYSPRLHVDLWGLKRGV